MKVYLNSKNWNAVGIYNFNDNSINVLMGSNYRIEETPSQQEWHKQLKDYLLKENIISEGVFNSNYLFKNPSASASIILGRPSNGLIEWVDEDGLSLRAHINRKKMIKYINENIQDESLIKYIKICNDTVEKVQRIYPLESIENLPIEKWDKRGSTDSLTYLMERGTNEMMSGFLGTNQNKLIYQTKDSSYKATNNIMNSTEGKTVEDKYKKYIKEVYYSIIRYSDDDYLENKDKYALVGANVLFTKLLSFYKPESILLIASPTYFLRILDYLELGKFDSDSIVANILLRNFIYSNIQKDANIYAVSRLVYNFYKEEISPLDELEEPKIEGSNEVDVEESNLDHIFVEDNKINEILNVLERKQNIILQGVPGVGKTFIIKSILKSRYNITKDNYQTVQFHQSYSYEEFVEGLRPVNGYFEVKEGLFKEFSNKAANDPENKYFFIIDEINRGNLSKIFGELLMLIESDKREDYKVKLPYSSEEFTIPKNLYIIGTMNTADRSLSLVDYALRRRFSFITLKPAFNTTKFNKYMVDELNYSIDELDQINRTMKAINKIISNNLSDNFEIGHSYFITNNRSNDFHEFVGEIYKYEIMPLVEEYFFDDDSLVSQIKKEAKIDE